MMNVFLKGMSGVKNPHGRLRSLVKGMERKGRLAVVAGAMLLPFATLQADDPHWIGLDTTGRKVTVPTQVTSSGVLDTFVHERNVSSGTSIYGTPLRGLVLFIR